MTWSDAEVEGAVRKAVEVVGEPIPEEMKGDVATLLRTVMTYAVGLVQARGGTMTAEDLRDALAKLDALPIPGGWERDYIADVAGHVTAMGARIAALERVVSDRKFSDEGLAQLLASVDAYVREKVQGHVAALEQERDAWREKWEGATQNEAKALEHVSDMEAALENARPFEALHADLSAQLRAAWEATGVSGTVKGMTTLADVVGVTKANLREALTRVSKLEAEVAHWKGGAEGNENAWRIADGRADTLQDELTTALQHVSDLGKALENARKERDEAAQQAQDWGRRWNEEESRAVGAEEERNAALQHVSDLEKSLEQARHDEEVWRERVEQAGEALSGVLPGEVGRVDLQTPIETLKRQRDEWQRRAESVLKQAEELKSEIARVKQSQEALLAACSEFSARVEALESKAATHEGELG